MKNFLKKLNNFRLSSLIMAALAVFGILVVIVFFVAYQTNTAGSTEIFAQTDQSLLRSAFPDRELLGFVFFMSALFSIILGVVVVALAYPYIMPKDKGVPNRIIGWVLLVQNVLIFVLIVLAIVNLATSVRTASVLVLKPNEDPNDPRQFFEVITKENVETVLNKPFWVICIVLGVFSLGASIFWMIPNTKCNFYCPDLVSKAALDKAAREKEEEAQRLEEYHQTEEYKQKEEERKAKLIIANEKADAKFQAKARKAAAEDRKALEA